MKAENLKDKYVFGIKSEYKKKKRKDEDISDMSTLPWDMYFDKRKFIINNDSSGKFCVYTAGNFEDPKKPCLFFLHGAGMTSLSFALLTKNLKMDYDCIAFDFRAHGLTTFGNESELDIDRLVDDAIYVIEKTNTLKQQLVIVGHSLGGAVAVKLAKDRESDLNIEAVVVIDCVEGTAIAALPLMNEILIKIPTSFKTEEEAALWGYKNCPARPSEAARLAIPARIRLDEACREFVWRTNLFATKQHWPGWFEGMSQAFLDLKAARLLILADVDRLDRTLTIAHMQGKFQLEVLEGSGHEVHENNAENVAVILRLFVNRNIVNRI